MEVIICPSVERVAEVAAAKAARIAAPIGPGLTLGVATGSSPVQAFAAIAKLAQDGEIDLSGASAFALDEYVGLPVGHPESYHEVIRRTVTEPMGLDPAKVHVPNGFAEDLEAACQAYEEAITAAGGVDIQFLGVGANGHIGFNEPTSSLSSRTRIKTLAARTRTDNARYFDSLDDVPRHCLTQGLGTIMDARHIILIATGERKANAIGHVVEGPVTAMFPGSLLQFHPRATVIIDEPAAAELTLIDYYHDTSALLPELQRSTKS